MQLEKTSHIRQIDIENASSAFIEVLAGNDGDQEDDFTVILPPVSFMTPTESKNQLHPNRMKLFIGEANLVKETLNKTWDRIKLVCTQPFNTVIISEESFNTKIIMAPQVFDNFLRTFNSEFRLLKFIARRLLTRTN